MEMAPAEYRCYELTRVLKFVFAQSNIALEVKDGCAFYDLLDLFGSEATNEGQLSFVADADKQEIVRAGRAIRNIARRKELVENLRWRIPIRHSWGIMPKEGYLVDCHQMIKPRLAPQLPALQCFPILGNFEIRTFLRVLPIVKSPTKTSYLFRNVIYWEMAEQDGNVIRYPDDEHSVTLRYGREEFE